MHARTKAETEKTSDPGAIETRDGSRNQIPEAEFLHEETESNLRGVNEHGENLSGKQKPWCTPKARTEISSRAT
jgi:hypothetical protein